MWQERKVRKSKELTEMRDESLRTVDWDGLDMWNVKLTLIGPNFGHVECKANTDWTKLWTTMETDRTRKTGCLRKMWQDGVREKWRKIRESTGCPCSLKMVAKRAWLHVCVYVCVTEVTAEETICQVLPAGRCHVVPRVLQHDTVVQHTQCACLMIRNIPQRTVVQHK